MGYNIPSTAEVVGNIHAAHMDPRMFKDPKKFDPDRHLDKYGTFTKTDRVIPFGAGECEL